MLTLDEDLDFAESWFQREVRWSNIKLLRYSLISKLSSDWQKAIKSLLDENGVAGTNSIGNCRPDQVRRVFLGANLPDPLSGSNPTALVTLNELMDLRNAIAHGGEPPAPGNERILVYISTLRALSCDL